MVDYSSNHRSVCTKIRSMSNSAYAVRCVGCLLAGSKGYLSYAQNRFNEVVQFQLPLQLANLTRWIDPVAVNEIAGYLCVFGRGNRKDGMPQRHLDVATALASQGRRRSPL